MFRATRLGNGLPAVARNHNKLGTVECKYVNQL